MSDLKFVGVWDKGAILRGHYYPDPQRTACLLRSGNWMDGKKPTLNMPDEF